MSEQDYGKISSQLYRAKDLYRVHDSSGKQKKNTKDQNDKEFLETLEETEKSVEGYPEDEGIRFEVKKQRNEMLDQLSHSVPPPIVEMEDE